MATAAALVGLFAVLLVVPPILSGLGRPSNWSWLVYTIVLLVIPLALLIPAVIRPQSLIAAVAAALTIGFLLTWGLGGEPMSWPRLVIHLAAILCLAGLFIRMIRGIRARRFTELWILPGLLLGLPIGYLVAGLMGLHIVTQYCQFPLIGAELSSFLCSG
ncbi:MAG: hypothetical protein E6I86_05110 [Chloroflexi bacterium]|nr:MAG: hypothetical protein E6I86_05110 [Chloroflexota bacterium]